MPWCLEFLRGNAAESPLSEAGVIRDADTGGLEGKILGFGRWRRLASIFYGMPIRLEEIVSLNAGKWQRFAVVNGRRALFLPSRSILVA